MDAQARHPERPPRRRKDLTKRADQQQGCLDDRGDGDAARGKLVSASIKLVVDAPGASGDVDRRGRASGGIAGPEEGAGRASAGVLGF